MLTGSTLRPVVCLDDGRTVDFAAVYILMDPDIREKILTEIVPGSNQQMFNLYCREHHRKYGCKFIV